VQNAIDAKINGFNFLFVEPSAQQDGEYIDMFLTSYPIIS